MIGNLIFWCSLVSTTRISVVNVFLWTRTEPEWSKPAWTQTELVFFFIYLFDTLLRSASHAGTWRSDNNLWRCWVVYLCFWSNWWSHYGCCLVQTHGKWSSIIVVHMVYDTSNLMSASCGAFHQLRGASEKWSAAWSKSAITLSRQHCCRKQNVFRTFSWIPWVISGVQENAQYHAFQVFFEHLCTYKFLQLLN